MRIDLIFLQIDDSFKQLLSFHMEDIGIRCFQVKKPPASLSPADFLQVPFRSCKYYKNAVASKETKLKREAAPLNVTFGLLFKTCLWSFGRSFLIPI